MSAPIHDLVVADIYSRKALGSETYGTPLYADNGRDALQDAYEESLDLACYLRQEIEERGDAVWLREVIGSAVTRLEEVLLPTRLSGLKDTVQDVIHDLKQELS